MQTISPNTALTSSKAIQIQAKIESAISPLKTLRFLLESEGNLSALQGLEAALLAKHTLLEITIWGVAQQIEKDKA